ncbi:hypothetical protein KNP414_04273 [Paenibacillus mucilaginosus KNP414]|uniref:Uncharacterized protein n=1 Tax=Paenibacillus mucilaginosus (strain KNP414) TaxID=1036673 RepID=F8FHU8_PAEMK|nr:hypothetical protein KNP414_04273 [Paenibacillus mucilaginosus KNP414]
MIVSYKIEGAYQGIYEKYVNKRGNGFQMRIFLAAKTARLFERLGDS